MTLTALIPVVFGILGLRAAYYIYQEVQKYPGGEGKVAAIGDAIHLGAMVYMPRRLGKRTHFCSWKRTLDLRTLV